MQSKFGLDTSTRLFSMGTTPFYHVHIKTLDKWADNVEKSDQRFYNTVIHIWNSFLEDGFIAHKKLFGHFSKLSWVEKTALIFGVVFLEVVDLSRSADQTCLKKIIPQHSVALAFRGSFEVFLRYVWGVLVVQIYKCDNIEAQILNAHQDEELSNECN